MGGIGLESGQGSLTRENGVLLSLEGTFNAPHPPILSIRNFEPTFELTAEVHSQDGVFLSWPPDGSDGYILYRNGIRITKL